MAKVKNKAKKKHLSDTLKPQHAKKKVMNPFEIHVNRQKYDVLGRKVKNDKGLPGVARAKAISKRKKTLLQEYRIKDKSNKFVDRRIGEKNSAMTSEDKIMARFTAERMKMHNRKSIFNLDDNEVLTHHGQTLNEIEKFDDPRSDDEEEQERLEADFVEDAHFGGGILKKSNSETSRKDLIEQLIAESKKRKAEKQRARERTIELTEKLDTEWKDLLPIMSKSKNSSSNFAGDDKPDSYDTVMRQLKFEARGKPSDRLKTEQEIAKEEKEQLEKLEEHRLRRMQGVQEDSIKKHKSADDLDDGFDIDDSDEDNVMTYNADGQVKHTDVHDEEKSGDDSSEKVHEKKSSDDNSSEKGSNCEDDSSDDDNDNLSDLKNASSTSSEDEEKEKSDSEEKSKDTNKVKADLLARKEIMEQARKELPYTFQIPATYQELQDLLNGHSYDHQAVILERMIKCNHPSLGEGYKDKLSMLFAFLLQHLQDTAVSKEDNCFALLDRISPHLYDLCHVSAENAGHCVAEVIREKQQLFSSGSPSYPGLDTLVFLKLVSLLFPTSDFRHPVVTPALVFMCQMLNQCKIKTAKDISVGLYLTTLVLEYTVLSKRFSPSAINFLHGIIDMAVPKISTQLHRIVHPIYISAAATTLLVVEETSAESPPEVGLMNISDMQRKQTVEDFKVRALYTSVKLLQEFYQNLKDTPSSYQIFAPVLNTINKLDVERYPTCVADNIKSLVSSIEMLLQQKLQYLVVEKKKPKSLRLYEPRIVQVLDGKKRYPVGKQRQERDKLVHKYKREMKGAVREIRRDKAFLAKLKLKQTLKSDLERKQKVKEIFGSAATQQGELMKLKRKK